MDVTASPTNVMSGSHIAFEPTAKTVLLLRPQYNLEFVHRLILFVVITSMISLLHIHIIQLTQLSQDFRSRFEIHLIQPNMNFTQNTRFTFNCTSQDLVTVCRFVDLPITRLRCKKHGIERNYAEVVRDI